MRSPGTSAPLGATVESGGVNFSLYSPDATDVDEKIPYLKPLGITAVELLPVLRFDSQDRPPGKSIIGICAHFVCCAKPGLIGPVAINREISAGVLTWR